MKPTPKSPTDGGGILAFGAHPDDIEFGCGGVIAKETRRGWSAHLVVCSLGESASHGTPARRKQEARRGAELLRATIEFIDLGGDAHFQLTPERTMKLAAIMRRVRPAMVLAPTTVKNQHPDHTRLGRMVEAAARIARYGGVKELRSVPPHVIRQLLFYAQTTAGEPGDCTPLLFNVSEPEILADWKLAMEAHGSQTVRREYVELQMTRARLRGLSAGIGYAIALFAADPLVFESLSGVAVGARRF